MKNNKEFIIQEALLALLISFLIISSISSIHVISRYFGITKKVMLAIIYVSYICHFFFYIIQLPFFQLLLSLSVQVLLHRLLETFPVVNTKSCSFYYSCCAFMVNKLLMLLFVLNSNISFAESILCFMVISLSPLTFFYYISECKL